jgi:hypothetical protein
MKLHATFFYDKELVQDVAREQKFQLEREESQKPVGWTK